MVAVAESMPGAICRARSRRRSGPRRKARLKAVAPTAAGSVAAQARAAARQPRSARRTPCAPRGGKDAARAAGSETPAARAHLRYIQRDGVKRYGDPGQLYSRDLDKTDGKASARCGGDRHQYRFTVSTEDGSEYLDLKPDICRLMAQMEAVLGTRLD